MSSATLTSSVRLKEYLRLADVPREFPLSRAWALEQVRLGHLKAFKPSKMVTLFRRADLLALLECQQLECQPA